MSFPIVILQSVITSLITVIIVFGTVFFFPSIINSNNNVQNQNTVATQEVPLYPLSSTFFGIPLPTNDKGLDSARLTIELHGKVYSKNKRPNGVNITIQTPETRLHTFQADNSTQIVNGNFNELEKSLTVGKEVSIIMIYDLKTKYWQMEKLTLL